MTRVHPWIARGLVRAEEIEEGGEYDRGYTRVHRRAKTLVTVSLRKAKAPRRRTLPRVQLDARGRLSRHDMRRFYVGFFTLLSFVCAFFATSFANSATRV